MSTGICFPREDGVYQTRIEGIAIRVPKTMVIEPRHDGFHAHRAFGPVTFGEQPKSLTNNRGFPLFNSQMLLAALSALLDFYSTVPKGRLAAVPKSLTCIF
ncbi:MAG TPA: hypothetical protein VNH44_09195 [Micropepsaceae bacterium]|nr:hypothetical protein [Micropepsaceae bacterium]